MAKPALPICLIAAQVSPLPLWWLVCVILAPVHPFDGPLVEDSLWRATSSDHHHRCRHRHCHHLHHHHHHQQQLHPFDDYLVEVSLWRTTSSDAPWLQGRLTRLPPSLCWITSSSSSSSSSPSWLWGRLPRPPSSSLFTHAFPIVSRNWNDVLVVNCTTESVAKTKQWKYGRGWSGQRIIIILASIGHHHHFQGPWWQGGWLLAKVWVFYDILPPRHDHNLRALARHKRNSHIPSSTWWRN